MTDEHTPEEELEIDGEDQDSGHDGVEGQDEDLDDELAEQEEEEEQERDEGPRSSAVLPPVRGRAPAAPATTRTTVLHSEDELPYIDDRASKIWVAAIVAIFALIVAYGLLFGKGGALNPPTPSPTPSPTPAATATHTAGPSPSLTVAPSGTPRPSVTAGPSATPPVSPTPAPSST